MTPAPTLPQTVVVSILNWNTASKTLACVDTLQRQALPDHVRVELLVIDNGSAEADFAELAHGAAQRKVTLLREPVNRGFAGGHNLAIRRAQAQGAGFIWLVNSDALVEQRDTLAILLERAGAEPRCGAISPLLAALEDGDKIHFCGARHDWASRLTIRASRIEESRQRQARQPQDEWVPGTAIMLRLAALAQVGELDERLFAYYEDDDICARLSAAGWYCMVAYEAKVKHPMPARETDRPTYYFYLLQRNFLMFWFARTPPAYRRLLWLKLMDQAFFDANRLYYKGYRQHAEAALLGLDDFLRARHGAPRLERRVPWLLQCVRKLLWLPHRRTLQRMGVVKG